MESTALVTTVAVLSGAAGIACVETLAARSRRSGDPIGEPARVGVHPSTLAAGLAAAAGVGFVGLLGLIQFDQGGRVRPDQVVHLVYLGLTLAVPLVAAGTLVVARRWGAGRWVRVVAVVLLVPAALGAYATHVEPRWLRVDHHDVAVAAARDGDDPVRIAVLADLQARRIGDHERRAIDEVLAAQPDVVLLPGDLFQGRSHELAEVVDDFRRELARLHAPGGVFFVRGDVDQGAVDRTDALLGGLDGITVLEDEVVETTVGDRTLRIGGTSLDWETAAAAEVRADLLATPDDGAVTIMLTHRPDAVLELPTSSRVDLTVAGHTHGGQVVLPLRGPLVHNTSVSRDAARGGVHDVDGNALYISPGVGVVRSLAPQVRFLSRPAVGILSVQDG